MDTTTLEKKPSFSRASQRLSQKEKNENNFDWYKQQADLVISKSFNGRNTFFGTNESGILDPYLRKKSNYDLFNNIINEADFKYVTEPFGEHGKLPANFTNRDIVSTKIKVLLGMEMSMPFSWRVFAVNEEATTRKEQEEAERIKDYVTSSIMQPIQQQVQMEQMQQTKGRKLTQQEQQQLEQQMQQEIQSKTPDEVKKYMTRQHQDPAEMLGNQLMTYLIQQEKIQDKFNLGWKHFNLSGLECYQVGAFNGKPGVRVVNSLRLEHDLSADLQFVEDGEWVTCDIPMTPTQVIAAFHEELTEDEMDRILDYNNNPASLLDANFTFDNRFVNVNSINVKHVQWKSLSKVGFLTYLDANQQEQMMIVDENYKVNKAEGDIKIEWDWFPETQETFKIANDIYCYCRPVPGQNKDIDNLFECKLSYYGAVCDNLNSAITSPMDRMKSYQYYFNIIMYRLELLLAGDSGKNLIANIKAIPNSMNIEKWMYYLKANKIAFFDSTAEGLRGGNLDARSMFTDVDLSLVNTIDKYIQLADYIDTRCGLSVGVTKAMEAQIAANEAVTNTKQNITQSSYILKPYFELHNQCKRNVMAALLEKAKTTYKGSNKKVLSYVLDDMSLAMLNLDYGLLENSVYGLFVANSGKLDDVKQAINSLVQNAMQNQQADMLDVIRILKTDDINEAEEILEISRQRMQEQQQDAEQQKMQQQQNEASAQQQQVEAGWEHEKEMVILKESERRKTEIQKQAMLSMGFDPNKDEDDDGIPDVLEVAKFGVDADIKKKNLQLQHDKLDHQKTVDANKQETDKQKLKLEQQKINKMGKTK